MSNAAHAIEMPADGNRPAKRGRAKAAVPRLHSPSIEAPLDDCEICDKPADSGVYNRILDRYIMACRAHEKDAARVTEEAEEE